MRIDNTMARYTSIASVSGTPTSANPIKKQQENEGESFAGIFQKKLQETTKLSFSKHAQQRMEQRDMTLSDEQMGKLDSAVKKAEEKGVKDTLILMDSMAFIINVPNNTVVTAMKDKDIEGNIFTQIDGAVIL